jgi:hypothetical protein
MHERVLPYSEQVRCQLFGNDYRFRVSWRPSEQGKGTQVEIDLAAKINTHETADKLHGRLAGIITRVEPFFSLTLKSIIS